MLRIAGGTVYDPANGVDGVVKDLCIADGRIVAASDPTAGARTIDASGMVVMPGGVDVHTHVAGGALNFARGLVPENQRAARKFLHGTDRRAGLGGMTPTTFATGYLYAGMGWTTVNEAAVPILSARHTHEELHDIPIVDKTTLVLMANNEFVLDLLEAGEVERARHVVAWLVRAAKAFGIKAVNPGGVEAWKWGKNANTLHAPIEGYKTVTPAMIIEGLAAIADDLGLPHPVHLHCNNLGVPGNFETTLETMNVLQGHRAHLAHLQFHAYGGDDWSTMRSEASRVAEAFNASRNLTADAGAVLFGDAVTITADGPWQHLLYQLTGRKWGNLDVENETGCGIVPYVYKDRNLVNAVQWAVGLELLLLIDDPWRIFLTTDHPNGGCFWRYPEIIHMLMNAEFRKEQVRRLPDKAQQRMLLADLDREYTLSEIAIITSAGPARSLGLARKGHLGVGADADVAIYPLKPDHGYLFSYPRYVIKGGAIVVEEGDVREVVDGRELIVQPACDPAIEDYLRPLFEKAYTMSFANYPVEIERLRHPEVIATGGR
ncbi:MAG TPA: formylmethanofuran dehydrogenase subunit A [Vicinamibacterales bacterium]|nr:formylmethanofuran dehydrogenase subunit A [Vicinamibacterales bacterium]